MTDSAPPEARPLHHLVSVWNPSYAADAMDAHLDVLLAWAERRARKEIEEEDVYVWWAKVRSANRLEVLPHREYVLAIDEQCKAGRETHLYLTDYRSLYVGQVGEITAEEIRHPLPRGETTRWT